jgi:hypothetical protein
MPPGAQTISLALQGKQEIILFFGKGDLKNDKKGTEVLTQWLKEIAPKYGGLFGKGTIDFPAVRRAMDDIHYRGWMHIESGVSEKDIGYNGRYLRSIFPKNA